MGTIAEYVRRLLMCCPRVEVLLNAAPHGVNELPSPMLSVLGIASSSSSPDQIKLDFDRWNGTMADQRQMISSQTPRLSIIFDHFDVVPFVQLWKRARRSSDSRRLIQRPFHSHSHSQSLLPLTYGFHHRITSICPYFHPPPPSPL